jgi:predicted glycogen debranching enzyme
MNPLAPSLRVSEWLETDGLGGFASGTASGLRTRRYHSLLLVATTPPTGRLVLANGMDVRVETNAGSCELSSQSYAPGIIAGDGERFLEAFGREPWPHWIFKLEDGTRIEQQLFQVKGEPITCLSWKILGPRRTAKLFVRPFLSGRDYHALHKANSSFRFGAEIEPSRVSWAPYAGVPGLSALTDGEYSHEPLWYYNFRYEEEHNRGLDCEEDLAAPGVFSWDLAGHEAALILTTRDHADAKLFGNIPPVELLKRLRETEYKRRAGFGSPLEAAADAYVVQRGTGTSGDSKRGPASKSTGKTIIAGYPWFTDWGRDTFIALRGLCLATGRLTDAREILLAWCAAVSEGMLPNRFPDQGEKPEFNAVDASLWFVIAAYEYLRLAVDTKSIGADRAAFTKAIEAILEGYSRGTRYGIHLDQDGLLAAGESGVQLTWMDAKVDGWVVTPRIGKPVEVQALWLNCLRIAGEFSTRWAELFERGLASFRERFWDEEDGYLYDVVDVDHQRGQVDATFRPNQILAVGGLPFSLLSSEQALCVVAAVEARLWVPLGLRSLAPGEAGYVSRYEGGVHKRDGSYHQGTVWPWLLGPFVEAWVRVRGGDHDAKREARTKFLGPLLAHLEEAGLGHISEIADGDPPHTPRGCPFQAWSLGEAIRLDRMVLAEVPRHREAKTRARRTRELVSA